MTRGSLPLRTTILVVLASLPVPETRTAMRRADAVAPSRERVQVHAAGAVGDAPCAWGIPAPCT